MISSIATVTTAPTGSSSALSSRGAIAIATAATGAIASSTPMAAIAWIPKIVQAAIPAAARRATVTVAALTAGVTRGSISTAPSETLSAGSAIPRVSNAI